MMKTIPMTKIQKFVRVYEKGVDVEEQFVEFDENEGVEGLMQGVQMEQMKVVPVGEVDDDGGEANGVDVILVSDDEQDDGDDDCDVHVCCYDYGAYPHFH